MKKILAIAIVIVMLATMMPLAAAAADAQVADSLSVQFPDVAGVTFTFTKVLDQYYNDPSFMYGAITYLFFDDGATISWDKDIAIQYQGAAASQFKAGETYKIDELSGYYFYNDDNSLFYFFTKLNDATYDAGGATSGNVNGSLKDLAVAAAAAPAAAETKTEAAATTTTTTTTTTTATATTAAASTAVAAGTYDKTAGTYTVAAGDCLWTICVAVYGNGAKWGDVWAANADVITNPRMIYVGQIIKLP